MTTIYVDPTIAGADTMVKIGNICYNRVGDSDISIDTFAVDEIPSSCDVCNLPGGIIARYLFDGDFTDETGNYDLTNNGLSTTTDPDLGGVCSMVKLSDAAGLPTFVAANSWTYSMWFKQEGTNPAGFNYTILHGSSHQLAIRPNDAGSEIRFINWLGAATNDFAETITPSTWYFLCWTKQLDTPTPGNHTYECWLGEKDGTLSKIYTAVSATSRDGNADEVGDFFEGKMTKLTIWLRAILDSEIQFLFDNKL